MAGTSYEVTWHLFSEWKFMNIYFKVTPLDCLFCQTNIQSTSKFIMSQNEEKLWRIWDQRMFLYYFLHKWLTDCKNSQQTHRFRDWTSQRRPCQLSNTDCCQRWRPIITSSQLNKLLPSASTSPPTGQLWQPMHHRILTAALHCMIVCVWVYHYCSIPGCVCGWKAWLRTECVGGC